MIRFRQTSSTRSDETTSFSVIITKENVTIREFIEYIITNAKRDWGFVNILENGDPWYGPTYQVEYRWGKIVSDNIPEEVKDMIIPNVIDSDGGWTRMDYIIRFEQLKKQA